LTLTSEGTLATPSTTALPALFTPLTADEAVSQAVSGKYFLLVDFAF
jgi:hypothetical protein